MLDRKVIEISPRPQFRAYLQRKERWSCLVVHRRGGKTFACIQDLILRAGTYKRPGAPTRYAYIAPTREQAKDIAWAYLKLFTQGIPGTSVNESELKVTLPSGSTIRLYSGESYERMRGLYFDGVILDEFADLDPLAWSSVIRPCLADYNGWATFIGTPKGRNALWNTYKAAVQEPTWFSMLLKASDSGLIDPDELEEIRKDPQMTEALFRQEFECDFSIPRAGAVYARFVEEALTSGRIMAFPWDRGEPVFTTWDLGSPRNTRTIYWQMIGREIHVIDHDTGLELEPAARVAHLKAKGYPYAAHFLPHDAAAQEKSGLNFKQQLERAGLEQIRVVPRCREIWTGINKAAEMFPRMIFHKDHCSELIEALENYHTKENKSDGHITSVPVHDWSSHDADAFRILAEAMNAGFLKGHSEAVREFRPRKGRRKATAGRYRP